MYLCVQSAAAVAAAAAPCVAMLFLPLLLLLLAAAVRHRVPHDKICCWFIDSGSSVFFLFFHTRVTLQANGQRGGIPPPSHCSQTGV